MPAVVQQLARYPVKGMGAESLQRVRLGAGDGVVGDRRYAFARADAPFDPARPTWLPKDNFLMLKRNARLARLHARFEGDDGVLRLSETGTRAIRANVRDAAGRAKIEDFVARFMAGEIDRPPRFVEGDGGHQFSDHRDRVVSLINLASVCALEDAAGRRLNPLRFRANLYFDGIGAWEEFSWLDAGLAIGTARLRVTARIERCAAVDVEPASGERNTSLVRTLAKRFDHVDLGVYATVTAGGEIAVGDALKLRG
ncbi:MAG: MOSC domain-containing protein [Rhodospirillales bacterium]|nr:MOSC domain-containing protein [Rhodospirillales bacterium]MDP6804503.1 MOSC domain-containing protein [Rhodospirillales bacterium]